MAATDLNTPLLPPDRLSQPPDEPQVILTIKDELGVDESPDQENPYEFLGSNGYTVPGSTTLDPFRNHTPRIDGVYEWVKILICVPIALVRLVLFGLCLLVGYIATKFALEGWKDKQNPMPKWRRRIMWITRFCSRGILFAFGYHWIKRKGKPAPREIAPIIVSNHVSYIEPIFFFYELFPTIVASESHDSMPFVGTIIRAMQVIYVNRFSHASRKHAVSEIKRKAASSRFPRLLLFPEGTTTNGRLLISFQHGAFIPGYPVQPVTIRYPHMHFDQSWGHIALATLMFRMFTQFHNFMEVEYLPVISPYENQKENAARFAERTGRAIATALNVVQTSHAYGDYMLFSKAAEFGQENPSLFMVEMARIQQSFHLNSVEAVDLLDRFLNMKPDPSGHVNIEDFFRVLRLKPCNLSQKIFDFIDEEKNGKITFKQFLVGSAHVLKLPLFRRACEVAFIVSDADKDQCLSEQEFGNSILPTLPGLNADDVHELFDLFDTDGDGKISKDDFIACLRKNPLLIAVFSHQLSHIDLYATGLVEEMV